MNRTESAPYYNDAQLAFKLSSVPHKMNIWGRGTGKTTILADDILDTCILMPRGKIAFCGFTYFHIRTKSMPAIIDQFERRNIYRDIHYFIGHKAPKKWGWNEPYQPPLDYSNCVHFWNGFVMEFISFDRPEMARSGSYDKIIFDEASKLKKSSIDSDILPTNRGNKDRFGHLRIHHGTTYMTTQPLTSEGGWVLEYEELMREHPDRYLFLEASALINKNVLGEQYFRDALRVMPKIIYDTEILNKRINFNVDNFYSALTEDVLYYNSYNYSYYDKINHDVNKKGAVNSIGDKDCIDSLPLYMSLDFGATQNCMVISQWHRSINEFPIINNFYVENENLKILIDKFIDYYKYHKDKTILLYGGSDGTRKNDAAGRESYFDIVMKWLVRNGWKVKLMAQLYEIPHINKFRFWSSYLSGEYSELPRFKINGNNAMESYVSMNNAPVKSQEFKKDKSSERDKTIPRWKATDLSDSIDNLYYWVLSSIILNDSTPSFDIKIL